MRYLKLGDICTIEKGLTGINKAIPGKYPLVVTSEERKSHNEFQFNDEAVIIPLVSSTGHGHKSLKRIHFQSGKFALGTILCAVIPNDKRQLSAEYLYRYLDLNRERELVSRMKGMANVTLPIKEIEQIKIPVPSLSEQQEFVESYKVLESKSTNLSSELTHQLDLVKQLRQAFLREAMQGKLVPQDVKDEPASELLKKIKAEKEKLIKEGKLKKQKELPPIKPEEIPFEIPKNWVWCRLGETTISYKENIIDGPFGSDLLASEYVNSGIPIIRLQNIGVNAFIDKGRKYITKEKASRLAKHNYKNGDIVICKLGDPPGKTCIIPEHENNGIIVADIVRYRGDARFLFNKYCSYVLNSQISILQFTESSKGMTRLRVRLELVRGLVLPLPPLSEQHRIVAKLEQLMRYCDELEQSIKQSQTQNEQLLQQVLREALRPGKEYKLKSEVSMAAEP